MTTENYIPMSNWGKDHWSCLGYIESVITECSGFQVGSDARMRQGRYHFRIMFEECPHPRRPSKAPFAIPMEPKHGSRLKDGSFVEGHDDWHCVQDMANEGLFVEMVGDVEPKVMLHLSDKGRTLAEKLRKHKGSGGSFGTFTW